jgi:hypothetical protein
VISQTNLVGFSRGDSTLLCGRLAISVEKLQESVQRVALDGKGFGSKEPNKADFYD